MRITRLILTASLLLTTATACSNGEEGGDFSAATNAKWKEECGSCHVLFPPQLLPAESWNAIMSSLAKHFGDDASIEETARQEISRFLTDNSKSRGLTNPPTRITETNWFKQEHDEVSAAVWKRQSVGSPANCAACHQQAVDLDYNEDAIQIPK